MSARVIVQESWERDGIKLALKPTRNSIMTWDTTTFRTLQYDPDEAVAPPEAGEDVWLHLGEDVGRALYEALARYYGDEHRFPSEGRADLLHERKRVDKLLKVITGADL